MTDLPRIRKRPLDAEAHGRGAGEIDIASCATVAYSSEDPAHPVEHLLDEHFGPGATRWMSARPDTTEHIVIEFDRPQAISRLVYEVEETMRERTQEVRVEVSEDGGRSYRHDGTVRDQQVAGFQALQGDRRARACVPRPAARRRVAVSVARRYLPEAARGRPHRLGRGNNRRGRQHRWQTRDRRAPYRSVGSRDFLVGLSEEPGATRAARHQAGHLRRP